jgi:hypothetical protein
VSDIFTEVDDEVRREELAQLWKRYGKYVFAAACLVVAGVAAWAAYNRWQDSKAGAAGGAYDAAARLMEEGKHGEAEAAFAKLAAEGAPGYQALAQLRVANETASRDAAAGVADYDNIAAATTGQPLFAELASVRAATLLVDTAKYDEMSHRLEPLTSCQPVGAGWFRSWFSFLGFGRSGGCAPGGAFRHTARELLALSAWRNGDAATARRWVDAARNDQEAPSGVRSRMELLAAILPAAGKSPGNP